MAELENQAPVATVEHAADASGAPLLKVSGELDLSNVETLRREIDRALETQPKSLVFDLSDLAFMDSSGIAAFLQASRRVDDIVLRNPSNIIRRVVAATGLTDILRIEP
jgi:anti-sigma B factor antagonist